MTYCNNEITTQIPVNSSEPLIQYYRISLIDYLMQRVNFKKYIYFILLQFPSFAKTIIWLKRNAYICICRHVYIYEVRTFWSTGLWKPILMQFKVSCFICVCLCVFMLHLLCFIVMKCGLQTIQTCISHKNLKIKLQKV